MSIALRLAAPLLVLVCSVAAAVPAAQPRSAPVAPGDQRPVPAGSFSWPLPPPHPVLREFEPPATPYGPGHRGVDLGGVPGQDVLAAGPGVVAFAGPVAGRGVVSIDHAGGLRTTHEPVAAGVRRGQRVRRGQPIGQLVAGHPECPAPACLHWGVRRGERYLDPLGLVASSGRVRLLPWRGPVG